MRLSCTRLMLPWGCCPHQPSRSGCRFVSWSVLASRLAYRLAGRVSRVPCRAKETKSNVDKSKWSPISTLTNPILALIYLFLILICITFCTTVFRLAFNKRFFDIAQTSTRHHYLFIKSYWSQAFIAVSFSVIAFSAYHSVEATEILDATYIVAAILSVIYLFYKPPLSEK